MRVFAAPDFLLPSFILCRGGFCAPGLRRMGFIAAFFADTPAAALSKTSRAAERPNARTPERPNAIFYGSPEPNSCFQRFVIRLPPACLPIAARPCRAFPAAAQTCFVPTPAQPGAATDSACNTLIILKFYHKTLSYSSVISHKV